MTRKGLILIAVCLGLVIGMAAPARSADEAGRVLTVKRDVYLLRGGEQQPARARSPLFATDAVATADKSRTKLFFRDDSILNLGELSRVEVQEYLYRSEQDRARAVYRLVEGSLRVVVGRSDLEIHTPTAVAAARGTTFIVWIEGTGPKVAYTGLMVLEGEVNIRNIHADVVGEQTVGAGQSTRVPADGPPQPPSETLPDVFEQFMKGTVAIGEVLPKKEDRLPPPATVVAEGPEDATRPIRDSLELIREPPISQEPGRAFTPGFTDVDVDIQFP